METKNPPIVYRMCSLLAALPLLLCISLCSRCYCLCLFFCDVWWMYEGGREDTCLLHAGSGWRVKDGNVRHRQIWWRLMAMYSSVCAIDTCHRALKHCHFHHDLLGAVLSNAAKEEILKQNEREWYAACTRPSQRQIVSSPALQLS